MRIDTIASGVIENANVLLHENLKLVLCRFNPQAEDVKYRKMAPRRAGQMTEERIQPDMKARRDAIIPKVYVADSSAASVTPRTRLGIVSSPSVSNVLHTVVEVDGEQCRRTDDDGGETCNGLANGQLETTWKFDDSRNDSTKENNVSGKRSRQASVIGQSQGIVIDDEMHAKETASARLCASNTSELHTNTEDDESTTSTHHRRIGQAKRRHQLTLDEPFTTYRRSRDGRVVVSDVPYRRRTFPMPGKKVPSVLPKLRKLAMTETEQNRQRMVLFAEGLVKFG